MQDLQQFALEHTVNTGEPIVGFDRDGDVDAVVLLELGSESDAQVQESQLLCESVMKLAREPQALLMDRAVRDIGDGTPDEIREKQSVRREPKGITADDVVARHRGYQDGLKLSEDKHRQRCRECAEVRIE